MSAEYSAGGLVTREGKPGREILMVFVQKPTGSRWTFPKGHIDPGETEPQAALREVLEETGWKCELASESLFERVQYPFQKSGRKIDKHVVWYRMKPLEKVGEPDPDEIANCEWVLLADAAKRVEYPSDKKLVQLLQKVASSK